MIHRTVLLLVMLFTASIANAQWDFGNSEPMAFAQMPVSKNLAVDPEGNIHAAFRNGTTVRYHMRQESDGEWLAPEVITDSASIGQIGEIAIAWNPATEQPIVTFQSDARIWFAARQTGGTWSRLMLGDPTEDAYSPDIAVNSGGTIYVVYITDDEGDYQLDYGYFNGVTWEFNDIEAEIGAFGLGAAPRMAVDDDDAGHVVFRGGDFGGYSAQHATNVQGGSDNWVVTTLSLPHAESYPGDVAVDAEGGVHCVSAGSEGFGIPRPVYYHHRTPEGDWSFGTPVVGNSNAGEPVIALDSNGNPHVLCLEISGNFYTGTLFYSAAPEWDIQVVYGSTDGATAFAMDSEGYGQVFIPSADGTVYYLESDTTLVEMITEPELTITPDTLYFGSEVGPGEDSTMQVRLENTGTATLTLSDFEVVGLGFNGPPQWIVVNLEPGAFMTTEVRFAPTMVRLYTGIVNVYSNADSSPDIILLRGISGSPWGPQISIEPDTLAFGSVPIGEEMTAQVRLENPNEDIVRITGFDIVSPVFHEPEDWHTIELWWGDFTTVDIRFAPLANQFYSAYAVISSNADSSPDTVYLTGQGVIPNDAPDTPLPLEFALHPLYPNPFNGAVNVSFNLPKASEVSLSVYDVLGREVGSLINGRLNAGEHQAEWNCAECAAGIYLFRLEAAGRTMVQKAVFAK